MVAKIFSIVGNPVVGGPLSIKKILANFSSGFLDEYYHKSSKLIVLDWSCTTPSNFLDFGSSKFSKGETLLLIVVPPPTGMRPSIFKTNSSVQNLRKPDFRFVFPYW